MRGSAVLSSSKAVFGAAAVLFGIFYVEVAAHTLLSGGRASGLWVGAQVFAIYSVTFAAALFLFLVPLLQVPALRALGAALSLPAALVLSFFTLAVLSLLFRDGGDPASIRALVAYWGRNPLQVLPALVPFLAASAAFAWFHRRMERATSGQVVYECDGLARGRPQAAGRS